MRLSSVLTFVQQTTGLGVGGFNLKRLTKDVSSLGIVSLPDQLVTVLDEFGHGRGLKASADRTQFQQQIFHSLVPIHRGFLQDLT